MESRLEVAKTKTLAVFENVVTKKHQKKRKFRTNSSSEEDSSPSESELVNDEGEKLKRKKTGIRVRLKEETIHVKCEWHGCSAQFTILHNLFEHLKEHGLQSNDLKCKWANCPNPTDSPNQTILIRHLAYHGYLCKLANIGENVLNRNNFPDCSLEKNYSIRIPFYGYECEWVGCRGIMINTIYDFHCHVDEEHIQKTPTGKNWMKRGEISCLWSGCNGVFSTRYKLADHVRKHTKERALACPECMSLFSSKTTFSDHRKRQLKTDMRSFQCSQCLKLFSAERLLTDHMRTHINFHKCNLCDMTCPKPSELAKHYRFRHMNVRMFTCHICSKTFVTSSNLNTHLVTHQDKPFKCDQCDFGCKSKVGLRSHMKKVHDYCLMISRHNKIQDKAAYECPVCKNNLKRGDYLTVHLIKKHKFHWPSGHCRFSYRKDTDGIHRLQTVRYESLEVTEQMIRSESTQATINPSAVTYNVIYDRDDQYKLTILQQPENPETEANNSDNNEDVREIIITLEEVDESGNVIESTEFITNSKELSSTVIDAPPKVIASRDMPLVDNVIFVDDNLEVKTESF